MLVESCSRTRWLDKLRPAGAPHRWMGRGGPMAPVVATGWYHCSKKKNDYISRLVHVILVPVHAILLCITQANYVRHSSTQNLLPQGDDGKDFFAMVRYVLSYNIVSGHVVISSAGEREKSPKVPTHKKER